MNIRIAFSITVKNVMGVLMRITLNIQTDKHCFTKLFFTLYVQLLPLLFLLRGSQRMMDIRGGYKLQFGWEAGGSSYGVCFEGAAPRGSTQVSLTLITEGWGACGEKSDIYPSKKSLVMPFAPWYCLSFLFLILISYSSPMDPQ
jgi:hypothetical protein